MPTKTLFVFLSGEVPSIAQQLMGMKTTPKVEKLVNLIKPKLERSGKGEWRGFGLGGFDVNYQVVVTAGFEVDDFSAAEGEIMNAVAGTEFGGQVMTHQWVEDRDENDPNTPYKSIEIFYDVNVISATSADPLEFRNEAMIVIEAAFEKAGAGEWLGAESGGGEVSFGFEVSDFEIAEKIVRDAVAGTPFDCIRQIARYDSTAPRR